MALPATKAELLSYIEAETRKFEEAISGLDEAAMTTPGVEGDWSVKDVAAHLMFWQHRAIFLLEAARDGYSRERDRWAQGDVDERNAQNYRDNKDRPLAEILAELRASRQSMIDLIAATSDDALFTPGRFDWLRLETLVEHISGETYEHYRDHYDALVAWRQKHV
jgi:uncharacterized protein (TIGR03083 family)